MFLYFFRTSPVPNAGPYRDRGAPEWADATAVIYLAAGSASASIYIFKIDPIYGSEF
jgi:hypothetical protein